MTALTPELKAESGLFLIEKKGWYYRPCSQGYTGLKSEAGRYSFEEAAVIVGPNGPDGPQDGLGIWAEADAPDYSERCAWDIKMKDQAYRAGFKDGAAWRPKVKSLEWVGLRSGPYFIEIHEGGMAELYNNSNRDEDGEIEPMKAGYLTLVSLDDLKAAAQADYEARVLSSLQEQEG